MKGMHFKPRKCTYLLTSVPMIRIATLLTIPRFGADAGVLPLHSSSQLVYPQLLEERTADGELMLHITDDFVLNLTKSSVAASHLRIISYENGEEVTSILDGKEIEKNIYHDMTKLASVSINEVGPGIEVQGLISPNKRIAPACEQDTLVMGRIPHVIEDIDTGGDHDNGSYDLKISAPGQISARSLSAQAAVPKSVTVEIFVISDSYHSKGFKNETELVIYVCLIINTVNIRLRATRDPTIQLLLTGLEISVNESFLREKGDSLNGETTIQALGQYAFNEKTRFGNPDTLYFLTGRDAYGMRGGRADKTLRGLGYNDGICTSWFVAFGEDVPGTFSGADTFAHEVGHLLGASHDGQPPDRTDPKKPNAQNCPFFAGYIMGHGKGSSYRHHYSPCSLAQMKYIVTLRGTSCWEVTATNPHNTTKEYPGMTMTKDTYCQRKFPTKKNVKADDSGWSDPYCLVRCYYYETDETDPHRQRLYEDFDALEYTPCAEGQFCIQGVCTVPPKEQN
uniref:Peptidase M12B domain-containing protein n=1 Tax=Amblyomma maculatum TaxID=34609 RepID=G3MQL5_AMBMU